MSTHIINFPGADIHTTILTSVSNVSVGENLDVTSNLTVSGDATVSGNVEVGTANLFVDTTTGNVGVGTANPGFSLDVHGTANVGALTTTSLTIKDDPHPELNFNFTNSNWLQQQKLTAGADAGDTDYLGFNVSISSDGSTAIVGAYRDDDNGQTDSGSAYIFVRSSGTWTQQAKLTAGADAGASDSFGYNVSISSDGSTVIVGAYGDDDNGQTDSGSAYIFVRSDGTWTQQAKLTAGADAGAGDQFGFSVSISSDGSTAIVGAYLDDDNGQTDSGSAYIFVRSDGTWTQQAKLTAGTDAGAGDRLGFSVSISGDGSTAIVGAYLDDDNGQGNSGSAYIFVRSSGTWTQQAKLTAGADAGASDYFGYNVSISSDGSTAIVGAYVDDDNGQSNSGSAYIFVRSGSSWTQQQKLTAGTDAGASDYFGRSVSISSNGSTAIVGAYGDDDNGQSNSGSAYIFNAERALYIPRDITASGFTILGEAHESEEFPPRAMTDYETHMDGHGVFKVYAGETDYATSHDFHAWEAFNDSTDIYHANNASFNGTDYAYNGTTQLSGSDITGAYIVLEMPYRINVDALSLGPGGNRSPKDFTILGSNNGLSWTVIKSFTGEIFSSETQFSLNSTEYFSRLAMVVSKLQGDSTWQYDTHKYFGTRERGQSTLHDGELKLTKSLMVPRIGPPLDTDDTPRRDRLVVEYNTSTNPTENGVVRDTSGNGLDGVLENTYSPGNATYDPYYDAVAKALAFDGSNDYVTKNLTGISGDFIFSASLWVYHESSTNNAAQFFTIGNNATNQMVGFRLNSSMTSVYFYFYSGNTLTATISTVLFKWNHFVVTYDGSTQRLYQNGVFVKSNPGSGLNLPQDPELRIGHRPGAGSTEYLDGYLSNFKLYDVALTTEEVKRLYYMGRCDEGHHVVNFSKTRVGIGLGDGEAPTYTLDVRGEIRSQGSLVTSFTGQHKCVPENGEPMEKGLVVSAKKNKFIKLNGLATGKNAITIDESLPVVSLSNVTQDKACFGVVSGTEEANTIYRIETTNGGVISQIPKTLGDNRVIVNSVGEGAMWVVNTNGPLESGDYITTSNVAGYGQKQDDDILHNYTVAKITMDCDFVPATQPLQVIKKDEDGVNVLDEHGQLQWGDHPTETEKAYKIRYLDASGAQTDEANAVHTAAFVGCTYHCG